MKKGGLKFVFSKKIHKMLKNPLFCDFLEKPSLDFAETYLFLILEVCSLKRNHFHLVSNFLGSQPILAQCVLYLLNKRKELKPESTTWLNKIEKILNSCNMRNVWLNPKSYDPFILKTEVTKQLTNLYTQEWKREISVYSSCTTYRSFKNELKLEKYLMLPDSKDKINISKFRCRNSKIPVVILAYAGRRIPYEERLCTLCDLRAIGDEFHYILQCPVFQPPRQRYLDNQYLIDPNREKFVELFQSQNFNTLRNLSRLISEINTHFK